MFDDQPQNQVTPPDNLPTEPVDIFAETEKNNKGAPFSSALSAGMLKKKEDISSADFNNGILNPAPMYATKEPILGKIILSVVFIVVLGGLGYVGWRIYNSYFLNQKSPGIEKVTPTTTNENTLPNNVALTSATDEGVVSTSVSAEVELDRDINNDKILFGEPIDSDKDGLDDVREKEIGTDPNTPDTDGDGLIDGDEVIIWKTNPLLTDTDGDSFVDGKEVRNGYNPLGPGKLFNPVSNNTSTVSTSISTSSVTTTVK